MDLAYGVALVVLAAEQRPELELVETTVELRDGLRQLGLDRLVGLLAGELVERLGVGEPAAQPFELVDVVLDPAELGRDDPRRVGVVPEAGPARFLLELGEARPPPGEVEVALGLGQPFGERAEIVGEVTHVAVGASAPVAELVLLAAP